MSRKMEYTIEEINRVLYGCSLGPRERRRRRKLRRVSSSKSRSNLSSISGESGGRHRKRAWRGRPGGGCCLRRGPEGGTVAASGCFGYTRTNMRRAPQAPVAWVSRRTQPRSASRRPRRGVARVGARGSGRHATRALRRARSVRHRARADRRRQQQGNRRQNSHAESDEGGMKAATAATSGASRCAANTLCPPGGAGAGAGTGAGGGDPTSLEARVAAFKADPALMEVATRFVAEVLERAKEEASKRLREKDALQNKERDKKEALRR